MFEATNRTFICSVVFLDIIGYSKQAVSIQLAWKKRCNSLITESIGQQYQPIILDTGDGAALNFLEDPEEALITSMRLLEGLCQKEGAESNPYQLRIGINLGAVKVVKDINGQPNIIGDGINVSQRVMSFANPNQVLASRSFYEVVACLTPEYQSLFHYWGAQKDKHVREHELYEVRVHSLPTPSSTPADDAPVQSAVEEQTAPPLAWDAVHLALLENMFAKHLGPIGGVLLKKGLKTALNIQELAHALSAAIPEEGARKAFLQEFGSVAPLGTSFAAPAAPKPQEERNSSPSAIESSGPAWNSSFLEEAAKELAFSIGPIAKVLVKKARVRSKDYAEFSKLLLEHIDKDENRSAFSQKLRSLFEKNQN